MQVCLFYLWTNPKRRKHPLCTPMLETSKWAAMQQTLLIAGNAPQDLHWLSDGPDGPKPWVTVGNQPGCMLSVLIPPLNHFSQLWGHYWVHWTVHLEYKNKHTYSTYHQRSDHQLTSTASTVHLFSNFISITFSVCISQCSLEEQNV